MIFLTGFILLNFCVGNYGGGLLSVAFSLSSSKKSNESLVFNFSFTFTNPVGLLLYRRFCVSHKLVRLQDLRL